MYFAQSVEGMDIKVFHVQLTYKSLNGNHNNVYKDQKLIYM